MPGLLHISRWRVAGRAGLAVGSAVAVNVAIFGALAALNQPAAPREQPPAAAVTFTPPPPEPDRPRPEPEPQPEPEQTSEPEPLSVPEPAPPRPRAAAPEPVNVPLNVSPAAVSPVRVAAAPEQRAKQRQQREPAPPRGPVDRDQLDQGVRAIEDPRPAYPEEARWRGREGRVRVRLLIDRDGRVAKADVIGVEGPDSFKHAVMDVIDELRFTVPRKDGKPVLVCKTRTWRFVLQD